MLLILHITYNFTLQIGCTELGLCKHLEWIGSHKRVDQELARKKEWVCYFVQASDVHAHVGLRRR